MFRNTQDKQKTFVVTVLPKVTREQALEKDPGLAWSRGTDNRIKTNEFKQGVCNSQYEGRQ